MRPTGSSRRSPAPPCRGSAPRRSPWIIRGSRARRITSSCSPPWARRSSTRWTAQPRPRAVLGVLGPALRLVGVGRRFGGGEGARRRLALAFLVALGIGFHNLGEGLAIGAAYSLGKVALGTFLVIGFTIHNTTEGLALLAPSARERTGLRTLILVGVVGGAPT